MNFRNDEHRSWRRTLRAAVLPAAILLAWSLPAAADQGPAKDALDVELTGSVSTIWSNQDWGGGGAGPRNHFAPDEFSGAARTKPEKKSGEPGLLGEKIKAGALSAVLPGAGQFYNGQRQKAYLMAGAEAAIWTAYTIFHIQAGNRMDTAEEYAGIYAGTSGEHTDAYWQNVARYLDSDAYNESRLREARALQEPVTGLVDQENAWQWVNTDRLLAYRKMRADAASTYDRRDFMILFAVVNRAYSVVDAVMGVDRKQEGGVSVLGMDLEVAVSPSLARPVASCTFSRGF